MLMWKNNDSMTIRRFYLMYDDTILMARWFDDALTWYFITSLVHCAIATSSLRHREVVLMSLQFRHRAVALSSRYLPVLSPLIYGNRQFANSTFLSPHCLNRVTSVSDHRKTMIVHKRKISWWKKTLDYFWTDTHDYVWKCIIALP